MKILWIGGWAIPKQTIESLVTKAFPKLNHHCIHPKENFLDDIAEYKPDAVIGHSLGSTLLLNTPPVCEKEFLIAPFLNIETATHIKSTQLKYILKWLNRDPISAINDFYKRAQLSLPQLADLPYSLDELIWGIETLIKTQDFLMKKNKQVLLGKKDPLVKADFYLQNFPYCKVCLNADHNLKNYLTTLPL